ncbi:MAG: F0F1 ATP synthase subunit epsilon [Thermodesulfovibrionales bacterium]|nr:F0F1 ATP synthase subunit epsilon [Thermodesulfovibrionales bacterium]
MSETILLDIVTPQGAVFSGEVSEVTALGTEGEFGVLPGHAPMVTTLRSGLLSCIKSGNKENFFVGSGYAEVGATKVVILADSAEHIDDIDVDRAVEARKRAEERMKKQEHLDEARAEAALERAAARMHVVEHFGTGRK